MLKNTWYNNPGWRLLVEDSQKWHRVYLFVIKLASGTRCVEGDWTYLDWVNQYKTCVPLDDQFK